MKNISKLQSQQKTVEQSPITTPARKSLWLASPITRMMTLVFLPVVLPLSAATHAEIKESSFEFSPFVGQNFFESRQNLDDAFVYGARFGYNFTRNIALEGAIGFVESNVDDTSLTNSREGRYRSPMDDVDVTFYNLDALYHLRPEQRFSPYIVAGIGAGHYSPEIADKDMTAFNFGVGAKYWLNENFGLRFDLRDYVVGEVFQESFHNVQATVGLVFSFGGNATQTRAAVAPKKAQPQPQPQPQVEQKEEVVLEFEDVHFDFDKAVLSKEAQAILKDSVATLKANPKAKVRIAGYTSESGTAEYNQELSERRAQAIKNFLISEGIKPNRLTTVGYGDDRPAQHESKPENLNSKSAKANMRALFEIVVQ